MLPLLLAGTAVLLLTATLFVASTRPRSVISFLLGVYLTAWSEIAALSFGLSAFGRLGRTELALGLISMLVAAVPTWAASARYATASTTPRSQLSP
jgi:hypothetical protein